MRMLIPPCLTTARLALRPVTPADRADLIALEADPAVMRFLNGGRPVPEAGWTNGDFLTPRGTEPEVLAARVRATGEFVGWFALFDDGLGSSAQPAPCAAWLLRDEAQGANSRESLDGSPEFATKRIARKTTARQGSVQNGRLTHLLACVCQVAHAAPSRHASLPVLEPDAHGGGCAEPPLVGGLRTAELGYRLRRETWGQGYGTEGVQALAADALGRLGFDRVRAETMAVNLAARRVLEKAGFRHVETVYPRFAQPIPGEAAGEVIYEMGPG